MGLLDDAIRQHLDLKRLHGADPTDVEKLEREAFGPIEREEPLKPLASAGEGPEAAAAHETAQEEELSYEAAEHDADAEWEAGHPSPETADRAEPVNEPVPELVDDEPAPEPVAAETPEPATEPEGGSARVDDPPPSAPDPQPNAEPGAEHDELEETPEFLQETPEHDRLWFEQKPPRDFDF